MTKLPLRIATNDSQTPPPAINKKRKKKKKKSSSPHHMPATTLMANPKSAHPSICGHHQPAIKIESPQNVPSTQIQTFKECIFSLQILYMTTLLLQHHESPNNPDITSWPPQLVAAITSKLNQLEMSHPKSIIHLNQCSRTHPNSLITTRDYTFTTPP
jgi:hypothetical protein